MLRTDRLKLAVSLHKSLREIEETSEQGAAAARHSSGAAAKRFKRSYSRWLAQSGNKPPQSKASHRMPPGKRHSAGCKASPSRPCGKRMFFCGFTPSGAEDAGNSQ